MKKILLTIWQLPQVLVGLFLLILYKKSSKIIYKDDYVKVYSCNIPGGISLGTIILINKYMCTKNTINHEIGHTKQSRYLGWLYLIIIGLPSILHAWLNNYIGCCKNHIEGYYHFYTEKWADKLGGVKRNN